VIHHSHIIEIVILELRLEGSHASAYWQLFFFWKILLSTHVFWPRNLHESDQNLKHLLTRMSILISSAKTWIMMMFHSGQHCFQYLQLEVSYCRVTTVCRTLNAWPFSRDCQCDHAILVLNRQHRDSKQKPWLEGFSDLTWWAWAPLSGLSGSNGFGHF
jgi:hypothetical protein